MLFLQMLASGLLILIAVQDLGKRSVSWPLFPLLAASGLALQWQLSYPLKEILTFSFINIIFLGIQFLFVRGYFRITRGPSKMLDELLGWGDVLFLVCAAFFLPVINFVAFYVISLLLVLVSWLIYRYVSGAKDKQVPLAGLQALVLMLFLCGNWLFNAYDVYNEQLLNFFIV